MIESPAVICISKIYLGSKLILQFELILAAPLQSALNPQFKASEI